MVATATTTSILEQFKRERAEHCRTLYGNARTVPLTRTPQTSDISVREPFVERANTLRRTDKSRRLGFIKNLLAHDPTVRPTDIARTVANTYGVSERTGWRDWKAYKTAQKSTCP